MTTTTKKRNEPGNDMITGRAVTNPAIPANMNTATHNK